VELRIEKKKKDVLADAAGTSLGQKLSGIQDGSSGLQVSNFGQVVQSSNGLIIGSDSRGARWFVSRLLA
jgi:hypothetical protein